VDSWLFGQNVVVAFISWEGANFEDAIVNLREVGVQDESIALGAHRKIRWWSPAIPVLGPEEITRDIPNVGDEAIKDLDDSRIIRIGAEVGPNDILVG